MSTVYKLDKKGKITEMAVYADCNSEFLKRSMLVAFCEFFLRNNKNTWEYDNSDFYLKIKRTPKGNFHYEENGDIYYIL